MATIREFDIASFRNGVAELNEHKAIRVAVFDLLSFSQANADVIRGGKSDGGSFLYQINIRNRTQTLFTVDARGYVTVALENFDKGKLPVPGRLIVTLRSTLASIPGFESFARANPQRPGFFTSNTLVDPTVMKQFQIAMLKFQRDAQEL